MKKNRRNSRRKESSNNKTKLIWVTVLAIAVIITVIFVWNGYTGNTQKSSEYEAERTSTNSDEETSVSEEEPEESEAPEPAEQPTQAPTPEVREEPLGSFSTKIYTKDPARQNNINITCSTLNDTDVADGETFSFCATVGQSTTAKGYQKADIFDRNGNKKKGLGGGNCQISTTLYNAVLSIPNLNVTERHAHSNKVPYIQTGKDAAVAYGSYDFKFINQTGSNIRIKASTTGESVDTSIMKLVPIEKTD